LPFKNSNKKKGLNRDLGLNQPSILSYIPGTSKKLLRVADSACDARCTIRTAALLGQIRGRSRRFFEAPREPTDIAPLRSRMLQ
jgi:hypothetical protein